MIDVPALAVVEAVLAVPAAQRGWLALGRVMLETRFPLGLFRAWSFVEPEARCLVYPRPERSPLPPPGNEANAGSLRPQSIGNEDFAALRAYQRSDSPRHVAWKAVARSDTQNTRSEDMLTKQFAGETAAELWLDAKLIPASIGLEQRLSPPSARERTTACAFRAWKSSLRGATRIARPACRRSPSTRRREARAVTAFPRVR